MFRCAPGILVLAFWASNASAVEPVAVKGSTAKYPPAVSVALGEKSVKLNLTGVGLRTKFGFGIYAIGSYLQDGATVKTAQELMTTDAVRALHLIMDRDVEPRDFVDAFKTAIGKNHPADKFQEEFSAVDEGSRRPAAQEGRPDRARGHGRDRRSHHDRRQGRCDVQERGLQPTRCGKFIWARSHSTRRLRRD